MQELLVKILTSSYFNRTAPRFSTTATAYEIPMVVDPWVEADPREPPVSDPGYDPAAHPESHNNAVGDAAYRHTARSLLNSVHRGLGWPAPARFPVGATYPNEALQKGIGQYFSDSEPGFQSVDLQGLLLWESTHGICEKPAGVASDWIDSVSAAIAAFPAADPGGPLTAQDVVVVMRDWLLGDGTIGATAPVGLTVSEQQALADYLGVPLNTAASAIPVGKFRGVCGVLAQTPQFLLAGITPGPIGPKPRLRVCTAGPCTYQETCNALKPAVEEVLPGSETLSCGAESVSLSLPFRLRTELLCPRGVCGYIPLPRPKVDTCLNNPLACYKPPPCDPRCATIDCCGGPMPAPDRQGFMLAWLDGATVRQAEGVQIRRAGQTRMSDLKKGDTLREGDLLSIRPGSTLSIPTSSGTVATSREGVPKDDKSGTRLMFVTGPETLLPRSVLDPRKQKPVRIPQQTIDRMVKQGWAQYGEAGRPLRPEERAGYQGPEEKRTRK